MRVQHSVLIRVRIFHLEDGKVTAVSPSYCLDCLEQNTQVCPFESVGHCCLSLNKLNSTFMINPNRRRMTQ